MVMPLTRTIEANPRSHTVTLGDADLPPGGHPQSRPTIGGCSGEGVGRHLPPSFPEPVGHVEQGVAGILALAYPPRDGGDPGSRVAVTQELEGTQLDDLGREVLTYLIGRVVDPLVSLKTESQEVVVLSDDLPSRTREVDLEYRRVAAQVVHM